MALRVEDNPQELYLPGKLKKHGILNPRLAWCVVQTRSNREKALARYLHAAGIPYYLPYQRTRTAGTRNRTYIPLFAGTLFMCHVEQPYARGKPKPPTGSRLISSRKAAPEEVHDLRRLDLARDSNHIYGYLFTKDQPRLRKELALIASEKPDGRTLRPEQIKQGVEVRVIPPHPYAGEIGRLLETGERPRLQIELHTLGQLISVAIDPKFLERI